MPRHVRCARLQNWSWLRTSVPELVAVISTIAVTSTQCLFD